MKEENHIQAGFDDQQEQKPAEFFHHSFHIESNINYYDKDEKNISYSGRHLSVAGLLRLIKM